MSVETIGGALATGWAVTVHYAYERREGLKSIRECCHRHDLDLDTLVWTRGRQMPLAILPERMRYPRCGSWRVRLLFTSPDGRTVAA